MRSTLVFAAFAALALASPAQTKPAPATKPGLFGHNLLVNGGAETPTQDYKNIPGWSAVDGFTGAKYGSTGSEWDWGLTGCTGCGNFYLRLAFDGPIMELSTSQTINVAAAADGIDKGTVTVTPSAYLGGFHGADTTSDIELSFQDATGKQLGTLRTPAPDMNALPKAKAGDTGLLPVQSKGSVPAGTRKIVFTWHAKSNGPSNSYLALGDNFSLVLTPAN